MQNPNAMQQLMLKPTWLAFLRWHSNSYNDAAPNHSCYPCNWLRRIAAVLLCTTAAPLPCFNARSLLQDLQALEEIRGRLHLLLKTIAYSLKPQPFLSEQSDNFGLPVGLQVQASRVIFCQPPHTHAGSASARSIHRQSKLAFVGTGPHKRVLENMIYLLLNNTHEQLSCIFLATRREKDILVDHFFWQMTFTLRATAQRSVSSQAVQDRQHVCRFSKRAIARDMI